jgi:uncharacterized membrane protein
MFAFFKNKNQSADRAIFGTMLAFGIIGLAMALTLSIERYIQLTQPGAVLACNINAIFNCGVVMETWQAKLFGFPNSFIGLMAYPVVITVAIAGLAGAKFPKWFWQWATVGYGLGLIFAYWLFFQSVFVIQVLCPLCLVVTVSTTLLFETLLHYNLRENNFNLPKKAHKKVLGWLQNSYDKLIVAAWLAVLVAIVFIKFPDIF